MEKLAQTKSRTILERLYKKLDGLQAVVFFGPGGIVDDIQLDPTIDLATLAGEYATLLRIATRTSEDVGAGNLVEHIVVSDNSTVIARNVPPDNFLIAIFRTRDQIGRAATK